MAKAAPATKAPAPATPSLKPIEITAGDKKKAIAAITGASTFNGTLMLPPASLRIIPSFNVRIRDNASYRKEMEELVDSIKTEGYYQTKPLAGFIGKDGEEDVVFITDGHRRLEAVNAAIASGSDIPALPVVLKDPKTSMVELTVAMVRENSGKRLSMLENAIIVKRLLASGMDEKAIASRLNFTARGVTDFVLLINAPKSIRRFVMDEKVTGTEAVRQLRKAGKDSKKAEEVIAKMVAAAAEKGKEKATRADSGDKSKAEVRKEKEEPEVGAKVKMTAVTTEFAVEAGVAFELSSIAGFAGLVGDTWYVLDEEREGWAKSLEPISFKATFKRPKKDEDAPVGEEVVPEGEVTEDDPL